jgi:hypothetical protein
MKSNYWVWELWEAYRVKPVAEMINRVNPNVTNIYTSFPHYRPSLNFYSDRTIIPASVDRLQHSWQYDRQPYLLVNDAAIKSLHLDSMKPLDEAEGWKLITKDTKRL